MENAPLYGVRGDIFFLIGELHFCSSLPELGILYQDLSGRNLFDYCPSLELHYIIQLTNTSTLGFMQPSSPTPDPLQMYTKPFIAWHQNPHTRSNP